MTDVTSSAAAAAIPSEAAVAAVFATLRRTMVKPDDDRPSEIHARLAGFPDPVALLESLFTASPVAYQIFDAQGRCLAVNDAFRALFGGEPPPEYNLLHDEIAAASGHLALVHRAFAGERITTPPFPYDARELRQVSVPEGHPCTVVASFFPLRAADGHVAFVAIAFKDVTPEHAARELAEAGQRRAEAAQRRHVLLARVSALMSARLVQAQRPRDLVRLLVPGLADLGSVALLDESGVLRRVAEAASDPEAAAALRGLEREALLPGLLPPASEVLHGSSKLRLDERIAQARARLQGDESAAATRLRRVSPTQGLLVPLRTRGRVIGVLTLGMIAASGRSFGAEDEALAREIGERAALGIDNARLFAEAEHARGVAEAERAALQVSEERRRLADEAAGTGTWDWDSATCRLIWDARCRELMGVEPDTPVDYSLLRVCIDPADFAAFEAAVKGLRPGDSVDVEFRLRRGDGEQWRRSIGRALGGSDGEHPRLIGTIKDISASKHAERELQAAKQRAEAANQAKDEFMAMLGHELRNPLSPILTALHLMRLRHGELMAKERAVIERQVHHMARLVDDLLDVSRITGGKVELKRAPVQLAEIIDDALEIAGPLLEKRGHRLLLALPRTGLLIEADAHRLTQAVANLLTNAARYTEPGGVIAVLARADEGWARLEVRDNGTGICPELLPRIFDLFVQGRRASDRADGGLGLGLAIVRSLVELHGGTVSATSAGPGLGSEFVLRLPLSAAPAACAGVGDAAADADLKVGAHRVLVVDDNRDAAEMLADVLGAAGYVACVAFDGPEALRLALDFRPELAVLDIGLPVMDGYELGRRLRELPALAGVRLVALTGYGQPADRERSRRAGFDEHLTKPVELAQVEVVVRRLLGGA
jgi:signal transduction histidine kinase